MLIVELIIGAWAASAAAKNVMAINRMRKADGKEPIEKSVVKAASDIASNAQDFVQGIKDEAAKARTTATAPTTVMTEEAVRRLIEESKGMVSVETAVAHAEPFNLFPEQKPQSAIPVDYPANACTDEDVRNLVDSLPAGSRETVIIDLTEKEAE